MKKRVCVLSAGLLAAGIAHAGNIAPAYNGSNITATVAISSSVDYWQQNGFSVSIGTGGTVDIQSTSRTINTTIGNGGTTASSLIIDGGVLNFNGPNAVLLGNGSAGTGTIDLRSGGFNAAPGGTFFIGRDNGTGAVIIRGGSVTFGAPPTFDNSSGNGSIDFADKITGGTSDGSLTITGADLAYYQGLYSSGDLTYNGAASAVFGDVFAVTNETISVSLKPASSPDFYYNLAKYQAVTADSATSDNPVQYATDGFVSQDNRWVSGSTGPHWLKIELAVPMTIGSAHLFSGGAEDAAMSDFVLQVDDNGSWVDIAGTEVSGNTLPNLNLAFSAPVTAQSFRLYTTDSTARVKELALYPPTSDGAAVLFGTDVDLNIAKLRQYDYSSVDGENYPKLAIDGYADNSSAWASANTIGPHDLEIHLPMAENIRGIQLYSGYKGMAGSQIQNFEVAYSSNATDWVLFDGGSVSGNTAPELNLWFGSSAITKYIRVRSLDSSQAVIRELVVLPENLGGYPLWTDVLDQAPPALDFMDYENDYYTLENRDTGLNLTTTTNSSAITTDEPQFQVLCNLGTDTFRLRSRVTERCFEVLNASTNQGAAIVEGDYSSMPHQRWRLEDAGDGEHVKIVNAWSGLVLGLDGTNVVQVADGSEFSKHWKINYATHFPKKGQASHFFFSYMYQASWGYRWTIDDEDELEYGQYYPMQGGSMKNAAASILRYQPEWYGRANCTIGMGFNEPDNKDQANMEVETAVYQWPRMERMRLPLLGPAPDGLNNTWRQDYEALVEEQGLRSAYMGMHEYEPLGAQTGSPSTLFSRMQTLYDAYGQDIMLTEFAVRDFAGDKTTWSRNHNYNWLAEFMWRAESVEYLKGWSIFEFGMGGDPDTTDGCSADSDPTDMNSPRLVLHYGNDSGDPGWEDLAECGLLLAGWDGNDYLVDETSYIIHNKGRYLRLIDHPDNSTVTTADVEHRLASEQFMLETAPNGSKYITGLSDGRRLSFSGSTVGLAAAGTTGSSVEWDLNEYQYGWYYIDHPSTGMRLRITDSNVIDMATASTTGDNLCFRFIKHYNPITLTEVQSLPYAESFEDGIGAWREFDTEYNNRDARFWEVGSGGTPTADAGPVGASDGDYYLFSEGHDSTSYATNMTTCVFDFSTVSSAEMAFDYHMYGAYIDFLAVDVYDGSSWTSNVWKKTGQQQTSSDDAWITVVVDLSDYAGHEEVTLRFRTANRLYNAADPAIDNIQIAEELSFRPVATAQRITTDENNAVAVTLSGTDADGDSLSYTVVSLPVNGTLSGTAPNLTYTPATNFSGLDAFTFIVNDGSTDSDPATVSVLVKSPEMYWTPSSASQSGGLLSPGLFNTNGTLVYAENTGGAELTFDGIPFVAGTDASSNVLGVNSPNYTGYHSGVQISSSGLYPAEANVTPTLSGLTIGETYRVQLLFFDYRANQEGRKIVLDGIPMGQYANGANGAGILATLVFVADASEFTFLIEHIEKTGTDMSQIILNAVALYRVDSEEEPFDEWLSFYGLTGTDALPETDVEPDGLDNLMEYALGGNPTVDDAAVIAPQLIVANGYADLVYDRNTDPALSFTVTATEDLQAAFSNDVPVFGESEEIGGFKTVTNRTDAVGTSKFIKLEVQK
ncbi:discoidin domain-containing protein [Pontiellaceae bacterium B12219]|nr:discoidin domain-containing protein [Pontiellaceae bacterium B12219]